jgi:hypothetical protein
MPWAASHEERDMKLSLPALLDAGRRFTAGLARPRIRRQAFTRKQLRQARRGFFLLGLTLATFIALHPPAAQAQDWVSEHWIGTWGAGPGGPPLPATTQTYTNQTLRLIVHTSVGVVNRGISGNRLLSNPPEGSLAGRSALERFDRDVNATAGVRYMTVLLGINDIGNSSATNPVTAGDIIAGYRQLISRAHSKGIAIHGATLTPFEGAAYYSADKELVREAVNNCIRTISVTRRWGRRCRWSCSGRSGPAI